MARQSPWAPAIGVVYDPALDQYENWVLSVLGHRYDVLLSFAETEALHPLHREQVLISGEHETEPWAT